LNDFRAQSISLINICIFHPAIIAKRQLTCQYPGMHTDYALADFHDAQDAGSTPGLYPVIGQLTVQ
jgi:hypothetical protein